MTRGSLLTILVLFLGLSAALADPPRGIVWGDLLPKEPALADPLEQLNVTQRVELRLVAAAREKQERGLSDDYADSKLASRNLMRKLRDQGLDVEGLLAQYAAYRAKVLERDQAVDASLDAQEVRLAGYLLPLGDRAAGGTEFLLVPFVGACIHVPPPPPNQVVVVRARTPFISDELFTPVRVTGRLAVEMATPMLSLVDGSAPVPAAYSLQADRIEVNRD